MLAGFVEVISGRRFTARFVWLGQLTQASPDGRYSGEALSKNLTPSVGMDKNGVTAMLKSAINIKPYMYSGGSAVDVLLHPSTVKDEDGLDVMQSILDTYVLNGGLCIQFNIFDADTLRDAQEHPEKYATLHVRVASWNVLWNNLTHVGQEAYIKRAANVVN